MGTRADSSSFSISVTYFEMNYAYFQFTTHLPVRPKNLYIHSCDYVSASVYEHVDVCHCIFTVHQGYLNQYYVGFILFQID